MDKRVHQERACREDFKSRRIASSTIGLVERRVGEQSRLAASGQLLPIRALR